MSNFLTEWRTAVMQQLADNLTGFEVRAGSRDGPVKNKKLAVVYVPTLRPDANANFSRPQLIVRAWVPASKQPPRDSPVDPEPVEQLMVDLCAALRPIRVLPDIVGPQGRGLYFELGDVTPDYEDLGVQVVLIAWTRNPAALP